MIIKKNNFFSIINGNQQILLVASLAILLSFIAADYIWVLIFGVLLVYLFILFHDKLFLFLITVLLLVLVGEINPTLRLIIQIVAAISLFSIVLIRNGFVLSKYSPIPYPILIFIFLLFTVMVFSILNSDHSYAGFLLLLRLSAFFFFVFLLFTSINKYEDVRLFINAIIFSAIIVALGTLYDFIVSGFNLLLLAGQIYRTGGFIGNFNATGGYFAIAIPLLVSYFYTTKFTYSRIIIWLLIGFLFIALIISGSRSALLSCFVSVFLMLFILNKKLLVKIIIPSVIGILFLILLEPVQEFIVLAFRVESGLANRDYLWKISMDMIGDNLVFGIGPGAYAFKMFDYFPAMLNSFQGRNLIGLYEDTLGRNSAHNFFLIMFTDLGILGLIVSLLLPYTLLKISKTVLHHLKKTIDNSYYLIVGVISTMTGLFVRSLFDGINIMSYGWISVDLPFWLLFSILAYYYNKVNINHSSNRGEVSL